ncbi:MAG TPA: VWA domain-containing protein [Bryobacteraceae bacterium]|nr:VWA domain-containing protein [Bryobacteraceae bacterium]
MAVSSLLQSRRLVALAALLPCLAPAATVRIRNDYGSVTVRAVMGAAKTEFEAASPSRPGRPEDVRSSLEHGVYSIDCQPADRARIDLVVTVPHTVYLEVTTKAGGISLTGLVRDANLVTDTGALRLAVPWQLANLRVLSLARPREILLPQVDYAEFPYGARQGYWTFIDAPPGFSATAVNPAEPLRAPPALDRGLPQRGLLFGNIRARGNSPERLVVRDLPVEPASWIKLPASAQDAVDAYPVAGAGVAAGAPAAAARPPMDERLPVFVADVRMVNLTGPVHDGEGRPVQGLKPEEFEVLEDGVPQKPAFAGSEELPFNLFLLLDLSTTTLGNRSALVDAARRFVEIARPGDKVAVYALAENFFQVISPLTTDWRRLVELIEAMPPLGGLSPLYDAIALSCAQEAQARPMDRNVLVVISDAIDNSLHAPEAGSRVPFDRLLRFAGGQPLLVYPIQLPPPTGGRRYSASPAVLATVPEARRRMQQLADATGGRVFTASSGYSMGPVYPLVAEELRHVYAVAYYPRNQNFDGRWRRVEVRIKRPGVSFRTREGYYAR